MESQRLASEKRAGQAPVFVSEGDPLSDTAVKKDGGNGIGSGQEEDQYNTVYQSQIQQEKKMEQPAQSNLTPELMAGRNSGEVANIVDPDEDIAALKEEEDTEESKKENVKADEKAQESNDDTLKEGNVN